MNCISLFYKPQHLLVLLIEVDVIVGLLCLDLGLYKINEVHINDHSVMICCYCMIKG